MTIVAPVSGLIIVPAAPATPKPEIIIRNKWVPDELQARIKTYRPKSDMGKIIRDCLQHLPPELAIALIDQIERQVILESSLSVTLRKNGRTEHRGVVSRKVVTTTGVGYLVDAWQNGTELENMRFHAFGSGTNAEAVGNTALQTEFTTEYATDNTRPTGSLTEGASANIFRTVGTFAPDANVTVEEHGILSSATVGAGVLWDRSLTGTFDLTGGADSLETTYDMTASAGG